MMRPRAVLEIALLSAAALSSPVRADAPGAVEGRVSLVVEGARLAEAGPVVAYLEPVKVPGAIGAAPPTVPQIHQKSARFSPEFVAIAAGQTVEMPNDDMIFHNVFSYSRPNQFDLGLYPKGESRSVTLRHPGLVSIYCSIHESMNGVIFVAPTPLFARVEPSGAFEIPGVPPGRYRLRTWAQRLPSAAVEVLVASGATTSVAVPIGQPGTARATEHGAE